MRRPFPLQSSRIGSLQSCPPDRRRAGLAGNLIITRWQTWQKLLQHHSRCHRFSNDCGHPRPRPHSRPRLATTSDLTVCVDCLSDDAPAHAAMLLAVRCAAVSGFDDVCGSDSMTSLRAARWDSGHANARVRCGSIDCSTNIGRSSSPDAIMPSTAPNSRRHATSQLEASDHWK